PSTSVGRAFIPGAQTVDRCRGGAPRVRPVADEPALRPAARPTWQRRETLPNSRRWVAALGAVTLVTSLLPAAAQAQTAAAPAPPRTSLNTSPGSPTGRTSTVNAGGNLQRALDSAVPGDVIVLQAGASFTGNFRLRNKSGSGWITIRSSAAGQLPGPGSRVSPSHASLMPKIVTPNNQPAIMSDRGAHHYRFIGIEFGIQSGVG